MTDVRRVDLPHASRLINHGPTVLVTSAHASCLNVVGGVIRAGAK